MHFAYLSLLLPTSERCHSEPVRSHWSELTIVGASTDVQVIGDRSVLASLIDRGLMTGEAISVIGGGS